MTRSHACDLDGSGHNVLGLGKFTIYLGEFRQVEIGVFALAGQTL